MMRTFERTMSRVLPPRAYWIGGLIFVFVVYVANAGFYFVVLSRIAEENRNAGSLLALRSELFRAYLFGVIFCAIAYAIWRAAFHPVFHSGYRNWLLTTPWTAGLELPGGPVRWVWQDGVVGLIFWTLATLPATPWAAEGVVRSGVYVGLCLVIPNLLALGVANFAFGEDWSVVGSLAVLCSIPMAIQTAWQVVGLVVIAYLITQWGVQKGLSAFPWDELGRWKAVQAFSNQDVPIMPPSALSPLAHSHSYDVDSPMAISTLLAYSGLSGWIAFVSVVLSGLTSKEFDLLLVTSVPMFVASLLVAGRLVIYCSYHWPPISFLGRIATGRWIVPGYDKVILCTVASVAVGALAPRLFVMAGASPAVSCGLSVFAVVAMVIGMGPTLRDWHLTGEHRLVMIKPRSGAKNRRDTKKDR